MRLINKAPKKTFLFTFINYTRKIPCLIKIFSPNDECFNLSLWNKRCQGQNKVVKRHKTSHLHNWFEGYSNFIDNKRVCKHFFFKVKFLPFLGKKSIGATIHIRQLFYVGYLSNMVWSFISLKYFLCLRGSSKLMT